MKRVMLVHIILFLILVLPAVSLISGAELNDFLNHCGTSGCYIYSGDGCGASPSDITYILGTHGYTNCATTVSCSGNSIRTSIVSDHFVSKHNHQECYDAVRTAPCVYTVPCQTNYRCEAGGGTATCEIDINLDDTTITDPSGNTITSARLNETVNVLVNGRNMVLIGQPLVYEVQRGGSTVETISQTPTSETQDTYIWTAGKVGSNFISGTYNFRITVAGETITTNDISVPVLNLTSALFTDINGTTILGARLNESINLNVLGSDLQGREIIYRIYRNGVLFRTFFNTATSNTEDSVNWIVGSDGANSFGGDFSFTAEIGGFAGRGITFPNTILIPELTDVFFSDLRDNPISSTGLNSLVKLNIGGLGLGNENVTYEIFEKDGGIFFFDKKVFTSSTNEVFTWRAGTDNNGSLIGGGIYYFTAKTADSSVNLSFTEKVSGNLNVSNIETNIPPVARITGPDDKQIYFIDEVLNFTQDSYDADDTFTYRWELGDGSVFDGDSVDLGNYSVSHAYQGIPGLGQKDIKLTVTDDRGLSAIDSISILIINSTYLLAYLDNPRPGQDFGRIVPHDARSTYAVSSVTGADGCTKTITCEAGDCPTETRGCPPCYDGLAGRPDASQCPIAVASAPQSLNRINFCWEWYFAGTFISSTCNTGLAGAVFDKPLRNIGLNRVVLNATLLP